MTREDRLYTMNGATLIKVADNLGVKVACNRIRTQLKESKDAVIARILAAEHAVESTNSEIKQEKELISTTEKETKKQHNETETVDKTKTVDDTDNEDDVNNSDDTDNEWEDNLYEEKKKKAAKSDSDAEFSMNKKSRPGKGAQLEYKGRSQNICAWAKELGISANTLYGRIYKMGWTIEKAFETQPRRK